MQTETAQRLTTYESRPLRRKHDSLLSRPRYVDELQREDASFSSLSVEISLLLCACLHSCLHAMLFRDIADIILRTALAAVAVSTLAVIAARFAGM